MRSEFMIQRHGHTYVLYAGLLDAAHELGLRAIETEILERPNPMNENLAIVKARVTLEDGRVFDGIGDASPASVGKNIAPHVTRMAETRAKARALRDAVNIGVTAFEEIGVDDDSAPRAATPRTDTRTNRSQAGQSNNVTDMRQAQQQASRAAIPKEKSDLPATRKQLNYLETLLEDRDDVRERLEGKHGKTLDRLSREEASEAINVLSGRKSG